MLAALALGSLFFFLIVGLPIAFSLPLAALLTLVLAAGPQSLVAVPQLLFSSLDSYTLLSIPFFILTAEILIVGGVARRLVNMFEVLAGHIRGGLASVAVLSCAFFAAISGSSTATAIAIGSILAPEMIRRGYDKRYTAGVIATAGGLGILIPPSIPMIVFGQVAEQSVGKLFVAGIVPGILLTLGLIIVSAFLLPPPDEAARRVPPWSERMRVIREAFWVLLLPVAIGVLIYGGIATPTETAGLSAVYAFVITVWVYRGIQLRDFMKVFASAAESSAMIMLIVAGATVMSYALTLLQVPQSITETILHGDISKFEFLVVINIVLFILGFFIDVISILLLTAPVFMPLLSQFSIDPVHFAVIFVVNMELALVTPPLGMHLFIMSEITKQPIGSVLRGCIPFALVAVTVLIAVTYIPYLSLFLVR